MRFKGHFKTALFALALTSLIAPQAEAIEIFTGTNPAAPVSDGLMTQVRGGRGGGGGGMHRRRGIIAAAACMAAEPAAIGAARTT